MRQLLKVRPEIRCPCLRVRSPDGRHWIWNQGTNYEHYEERDGQVFEKGAKYKPLGVVVERFDHQRAADLRDRGLAELFDALLGGVLRENPEARKLTIFPEKNTWELPFGLLLSENGALYETHTVEIAHSPAVWYRLKIAPKRRHAREVLVFADAVYNQFHGPMELRGGGERLSNLPNTRKEALFLRKLFYGEREGASRDRLLDLDANGVLKEYRYLHFALHGRHDPGDVEKNALLFSRPELIRKHAGDKVAGEPIRQHDLRLGEIQGLEVMADLVTLSACESSLGESVSGEGLIGLPHAFLLAGARHVLGSLWAVDDRVTVEFMREFYTALRQGGLDPPDALGVARRVMAARYDDPYYWASFVLFSG